MKAKRSSSGAMPVIGDAVDIQGNPAFDPSANVIALTEAANKRQDDLRRAHRRFVAMQMSYIEKIGELRAAHTKEMMVGEAERLNSIRQVDVTAVKTEADRALAAIQVLATQTQTNAENLRNALTSTAATIAKQTSDTVAQLIERIAALEKSSYEGKGKSSYADPMMIELNEGMKALRGTKSEGLSLVMQIGLGILTAGGIVFGIMMYFK